MFLQVFLAVVAVFGVVQGGGPAPCAAPEAYIVSVVGSVQLLTSAATSALLNQTNPDPALLVNLQAIYRALCSVPEGITAMDNIRTKVEEYPCLVNEPRTSLSSLTENGLLDIMMMYANGTDLCHCPGSVPCVVSAKATTWTYSTNEAVLGTIGDPAKLCQMSEHVTCLHDYYTQCPEIVAKAGFPDKQTFMKVRGFDDSNCEKVTDSSFDWPCVTTRITGNSFVDCVTYARAQGNTEKDACAVRGCFNTYFEACNSNTTDVFIAAHNMLKSNRNEEIVGTCGAMGLKSISIVFTALMMIFKMFL